MTEPYLYNKVDSTRERAKIVRKCPKCGSEMAFGIKRSERKPRKILYEFMWCTNKWCGHEEKVGGEK